MDKKKKLRIIVEQYDFVLPYIIRELPEYDVVTDGECDECTVIIPPDGTIPEGSPDTATVLLCPNVVGTKMNGLPMDIAQRIASGSYFHIVGNDARLSTIHAHDVAKAVRLTFGKGGRHKVTDGNDPTFYDFAEALAFRIKNKRILELKPMLAKFIIPKALRTKVTTDHIVDGSEFAEKFNFYPTPVTEYLRTHVYDDESL